MAVWPGVEEHRDGHPHLKYTSSPIAALLQDCPTCCAPHHRAPIVLRSHPAGSFPKCCALLAPFHSPHSLPHSSSEGSVFQVMFRHWDAPVVAQIVTPRFRRIIPTSIMQQKSTHHTSCCWQLCGLFRQKLHFPLQISPCGVLAPKMGPGESQCLVTRKCPAQAKGRLEKQHFSFLN